LPTDTIVLMNILVTGGAGFIGSHIVAELAAQGHAPVIIDSMVNSDQIMIDGIEKITGQQVSFYDADIRNTDKVTEILQQHHCDAVIHLAAFKSVGESVKDPLKYYDNNMNGLISVLEAMSKAGTNLIIFSSSTTVYGDPETLPMTEGSPIQPPTNPYGATKQMAEQIIQDTCKATGIRSVLLRYFNPVGAHPSGLIGELPIGVPNFLLPYIMQTVTGARDHLTVFGSDYDTPDGSPMRDYIHVVDLAKAHIAALHHVEKSQENTEVFNIGTGKPTSVLEFIHTFEKANDVKIPYQVGPRRAGDIACAYASVDKANKVLGWKAEHTLEQALKDAWHWQQGLEKSVF
jgi:UDP-glucose 4-epimerase